MFIAINNIHYFFINAAIRDSRALQLASMLVILAAKVFFNYFKEKTITQSVTLGTNILEIKDFDQCLIVK